MKPRYRLLLVDDSPEYRQMVQDLLHLEGSFEILATDSLAGMREYLDDAWYDAIILDHNLPDGTGLDALVEIASDLRNPPVLMITGQGDEQVASEAIKRGAYDYLVKSGDDIARLPQAVRRVVGLHEARLARRVAEEKARYQAWLLDNVSDAIVVTTVDRRVRFWNAGAEALFGVPQSEVIGRDLMAVLCPEVDAPCLEPIQRLLQDDQKSDEFVFRLNDGRRVWVNGRSSRLYEEDGRYAGMMAIFRDVSQRKELEAKVRAAQARLLKAARQSAMGELASSMAHQINNPLTTVLGEAQILAKSLAPEMPEYGSAKAIQEAGWRAVRVVEKLMDLSSPSEASADRVDINSTILSAIELVGNRIEQKGALLRLSLAPGLPRIQARERDLLDAWVNLLLSARDASAGFDGVEIRVETNLRQDAVEVKIQFPGKLAYDRLSADEESDPDPPGLLGLAIGEEIIRQNRGDLEFQSRGDTESEITVCLPVSVVSTQGELTEG